MIFTRYDDLDSDKAFEIWLSNCPTLKAFIEKTNIKCFHFANENGIKPIKDQVNDLMSTITGLFTYCYVRVNINNRNDFSMFIAQILRLAYMQ